MINDDSSTVIVGRKMNGTIRENSLYHFLMDHLKTEPLINYRVDVSRGDRRVLYVRMQVGANAITIFPGFKLTGQHLSIDQCVINEKSPLAKNFSPMHATLEYTRENESIIVHAYFKRNGQFNTFNAKTYSMENSIKTNGIPRVISDQEKKLIRDQAVPCQTLLMDLINQKHNRHIALYNESFILDDELSDAIRLNDSALAIEKAENLRAVASKITRYNDLKQDGRTNYLNRKLANFNGNLVSENIVNHEESVPFITNSPKQENPSKQTVRKKVKQSSRQEDSNHSIKNQIDLLVQEVIDHPLIKMESKLQELYSLFLLLDINSHNNENKAYILQQRLKLPVDRRFSDYFNDMVLAGDVETVSVLYPKLSERTDMLEVCSNLISAIQKNPGNCEGLISVADFFYEHSEIYRSFIITKNQMIPVLKNPDMPAVGLLLDFFQKNNLPAFNMALRHGVSPDSPQYFSNGIKFNALKSIIHCYHKNPQVSFVHSLIESGAQVDISGEQPREHEAQVIRVSKNSDLFLGSENNKIFKNNSRVSEKNNALMYAISIHSKSYPDLILELCQHVTVDVLLSEAKFLMRSDEFDSRFVGTSNKSGRMLFCNIPECDEYTKELIQSHSGAGCCFLYYMDTMSLMNTKNERMLFESANHLLVKAQEIFSDMTPNEQTQIITTLTQQAREQDDFNAMASYEAAQLAYTMISEPSLSNHQAMALLYLFMIKRGKEFCDTSLYCDWAVVFLRSLPLDELAKIAGASVVIQLIKQIEVMCRNETRLLHPKALDAVEIAREFVAFFHETYSVTVTNGSSLAGPSI